MWRSKYVLALFVLGVAYSGEVCGEVGEGLVVVFSLAGLVLFGAAVSAGDGECDDAFFAELIVFHEHRRCF
jgi:hypothetical protein